MKFPIAKTLPVAVTHGRVSYTDNYQWLEEESAESLAFQDEQDSLTQEWLSTRPVSSRASALVAALPQAHVDTPTCCGGRWFRTHTPEGQHLEVIEIAEAVQGPWRCVVDMKAMANGEPAKVDAILPSPDGGKLLFMWSRSGREQENLWVIDVASGARLLEGVPQLRPTWQAWFADSSGFYYAALDPANLSGYRVYRQALGAPAAVTPEDFEPVHAFEWPKAASDGKHFFIISNHLNPQPTYIRDESSGGGWRPFLKGEAAFFRGDIIGDRYYAVTNDGAPLGRIVSIPLATPRDHGTWKEIIPGVDGSVLGTMQVVDNHLVVADLVDTWSRLRVFDAQGRLKGEIPLPGRGTLGTGNMVYPGAIDMVWKGDGSSVLFHFSAPTQSPGLYRADIHTMKVETLVEPAVKIEAGIHSHAARAVDGVRVPYQVIARPGTDLTTPRPTVIFGYGGFGASVVPGWCGNWVAAWVKAGGVLVIAHLRGGAELGPQMWQDGRMQKKQNSYNDVYAVAEDLIARGITTAAQLGVQGASNGGIMVAAVAVQRPDLFRAGIAQVPATDILGVTRDPVCLSICVLDYGNPDDAEMSEVINAWSPYQNVKDGVKYPALLLDSGKSDPRCPPWHVRKMAARMQPANAGANPILMRVRSGSGHNSYGASAVQQDADFVTFFADQLGLAL